MQSYIDSGELYKPYERKVQKKTSMFYKLAMEEKLDFGQRYEKDTNNLTIFTEHPELREFQSHFEERNARFYHRLDRIITNETTLLEFAKGHKKYGFVIEDTGIRYREWAPEAININLVGDFNGFDLESHQLTKDGPDFEIFLPKNEDGSHAIDFNTKLQIQVDGKSKLPCWTQSITSANGEIYATLQSDEFTFQHQRQKPAEVKSIEITIENDYSQYIDQIKKYVDEGINTFILNNIIYSDPEVLLYFALKQGSKQDLKQFIDFIHSLGAAVILDFPLRVSQRSPLIRFDNSQYHYVSAGTKHPHLDFGMYYNNFQISGNQIDTCLALLPTETHLTSMVSNSQMSMNKFRLIQNQTPQSIFSLITVIKKDWYSQCLQMISSIDQIKMLQLLAKVFQHYIRVSEPQKKEELDLTSYQLDKQFLYILQFNYRQMEVEFDIFNMVRKENKGVKRVSLHLEQSLRFISPFPKNVRTQYAHIYWMRYSILSQRFTNYPIKNRLDKVQTVNQQKGTIQVIGTIYKEMKLKPYYFNQKSDVESKVLKTDYCYLEDISGRIKLSIEDDAFMQICGLERQLTVGVLVTGLVVMVEGTVEANNIVRVTRMYFPEMKQSIPKYIAEDCYLCLISGLNFNDVNDQVVNKLINLLQGNLIYSPLIQKISQVIIAGNLFCRDELEEHVIGQQTYQTEFRELHANIASDIQSLQDFIKKLGNFVPVAIMPGSKDPVSTMWPQMPFTKAHFQNATLLSNPCELSLEGIHIIGTSGDNIHDIMQYSQLSDDPLTILEATLYWQHIAPTLPDTLKSYPMTDSDPFILDQMPQIYFAGNMKEFQKKKLNDTIIITVPVFSQSHSFCLVNLRTFDCIEISL